jgi:hypothetical protein
MKKKKFTIFLRLAADGLTAYTHVEVGEIDEAYEIFLREFPHSDVIGAFDGHVTPLWWERP